MPKSTLMTRTQREPVVQIGNVERTRVWGNAIEGSYHVDRNADGGGRGMGLTTRGYETGRETCVEEETRGAGGREMV